MINISYKIKKLKEEEKRDGLGDLFLVNLEHMDGHSAGGGELLVADMALEVLGFLVLHQYLLVFKLPVAVVAPHLIHRPSLLLLPHSSDRRSDLSTSKPIQSISQSIN